MSDVIVDCRVVSVQNWDKLVDLQKNYRGGHWAFRGQANSDWELETRLDRALREFGINHSSYVNIERGLLRRFKRQCYHYLTDLPHQDDDLEWLALMQHYGAPTRLLDWTYSFYVAMYFAIENTERDCAVWALNTDWLVEPLDAVIRKHTDTETWLAFHRDRGITKCDTFRQVFLRKEPIALVGAVNPFRLNERLVLQQGVFLCPGDVSKPFQENMVEIARESASDWQLTRIVIQYNRHERNEILLRLHEMNMNSATLFPGLEGFARSLRPMLAYPELLLHDPDD